MKKRIVWIAVGVLALTAVVVTSVFGGDGLEVETALVSPRSLQVSISEEGRTRVVDRYVVTAPVAGQLDRILLREGDAVEAGQVVARISPALADSRTQRVLAAQVESAVAQRAQALAQLEDLSGRLDQTDRELGRVRALARDSILSSQELENAELAAESGRRMVSASEAALAAAEANLTAARAALSGTRGGQAGGTLSVRTPASGRVMFVPERSERTVAVGTPLLELGDSEAMEIVVDVLSEDAVRIDVGDSVVIDDWGGDRTLSGRVQRIEPSAFTKVSALGVEEQRVNVVVDLDERPERLGAGYRVEAAIVVWEEPEVLTIPSSAIFSLEGSWQAFAIQDGRAELTVLQLGQRSSEFAQVLAGLEDGDRVIVHPTDAVGSGTSVSWN
jgi:HlyD family secretion protein